MIRATYLGRDTPTPENACLDCGTVMDMALGVGHRGKPKAGDITICMTCGHVMAFDGNLRFRPLTDTEMVDVAADPVILAAQATRDKVIKAVKGKSNG